MKGLKSIGLDKNGLKKAAPKMAGAFIGGAAAGAVVKGISNALPEKYRNEKVVNAVPLVLGVLLAVQKNDFASGAGYAMIGVGSQKYGAMLGLGDPYFLGDAANGVPEYIVVEGLDEGRKMLGNTATNELPY